MWHIYTFYIGFLSLNHNVFLLTTDYLFFLPFSLFHYVDYAHRHICIRFHRNGKICSKDRWCTISDVKRSRLVNRTESESEAIERVDKCEKKRYDKQINSKPLNILSSSYSFKHYMEKIFFLFNVCKYNTFIKVRMKAKKKNDGANLLNDLLAICWKFTSSIGNHHFGLHSKSKNIHISWTLWNIVCVCVVYECITEVDLPKYSSLKWMQMIQ